MAATLAFELENFIKGKLEGIKYVDYWAVDYDYGKKKDKEGNPIFTNHWEDFRTKKDRSLDTRSGAFRCELGKRTCAIKVIDVWANETLQVFEITI